MKHRSTVWRKAWQKEKFNIFLELPKKSKFFYVHHSIPLVLCLIKSYWVFTVQQIFGQVLCRDTKGDEILLFQLSFSSVMGEINSIGRKHNSYESYSVRGIQRTHRDNVLLKEIKESLVKEDLFCFYFEKKKSLNIQEIKNIYTFSNSYISTLKSVIFASDF